MCASIRFHHLTRLIVTLECSRITRCLCQLRERSAPRRGRWQLVDDLLALDQIEGGKALAELPGLCVAHVDVVPDLEAVGGLAEERRLHLARPFLTVQAKALRQ